MSKGQGVLKFKLKSGRLAIIRVADLSDAEAIRDMKNEHLLEDGPIPKGKETELVPIQTWLEDSIKQIKDQKYILVYAWLGNKIIGECSIERQAGTSAHTGELGISTINDFRQQGVARALLKAVELCSKEFGIKIIKLTTEETNVAARGLYEKCGYDYYGKLPKAYFKDNKYIDQVLMFKEI